MARTRRVAFTGDVGLSQRQLQGRKEAEQSPLPGLPFVLALPGSVGAIATDHAEVPPSHFTNALVVDGPRANVSVAGMVFVAIEINRQPPSRTAKTGS